MLIVSLVKKYKQEDIIKMYGKIHDELKDKIEKETTAEVKTEEVVRPDKGVSRSETRYYRKYKTSDL